MTLQTLWSPARRILLTLPVLWVVVSLVFLLIHLVPGAYRTDAWRRRHRIRYLSAAPLLWSRRAARPAVHPLLVWHPPCRSRPVAAPARLGHRIWCCNATRTRLRSRWPRSSSRSLPLFPAGVLSALHRSRWQDRTLGVVSLVGLSFPNFALGPILILLFSIKLGWLPVSTAGTGSFFSGDFLLHLILPAVTLGLSLAAILTRMVRTAMLEELGQDYIRTARAKGLTENQVVYRHALRNALIPVLTVVGLQFGSLLAGAIVTETIFSWPGIGRLTLSAISNRDYALVQGCILAVGLTYVAVNLLTDIAYTIANPRIRTQ